MRQVFPAILALFLIALAQPVAPTPMEGYAPPWDEWIWDQDWNELHDYLDDFLESPSGNVTVPVHFSSRLTEQEFEEFVAEIQPLWYHNLTSMAVVLVKVNVSTLLLIPPMAKVVAVDYLPPVSPFMETSVRSVKARPSTEYSPNTAFEAFGVTGRGVLMGVLGTGVDDQIHELLRDKFHVGGQFTGQNLTCYNPTDGNNRRHETGVAGLALGRMAQTKRGVANESTLADFRIGNANDAVSALDWAINWNAQTPGYGCPLTTWKPVRVMNWSGGFTDHDDCGISTLSTMIKTAFKYGIVVVRAAGNEGAASNTLRGPNPDGGMVLVGSVNDYDTVSRANDKVASHSSRGLRCSDNDGNDLDELLPTLVAPGTDIVRPISCDVGDQDFCSDISVPCSDCYITRAGTSYAAPHVAGIVAMMIELRPCLAPNSETDTRIRDLLINSTEYATAAETTPPQEERTGLYGRSWNNAWGYGNVDAYEAMQRASDIQC